MTTVSIPFPAKRKRGRPRKDGNLSRESSLQSLENQTQAIYPTLESIKKTQEFDRSLIDESVDRMVGSVIYGVIEGSFDAGYFISVRIGSSGTPYRGVVFQPKKIVPITAVNDVAPQAKMFERREVSIPAHDDSKQMSGVSSNHENPVVNHPVQTVFQCVSPSVPVSRAPYPLSNNHSGFMVRSSSCSDLGQKINSNPSGVDKKNLRMVEEDEVMQAFEVSSSTKGNTRTDTMMSEFLYRGATDSVPDKQHLNPSPLTPNLLHSNEPTVSNLEQHVAPSVHEIQQDELISSEDGHPRKFFGIGLQSSEIQQQETPPGPQMQQYYNSQLHAPGVSFHQSPFLSQSQHHSSCVAAADYQPNLNLNLASTTKNPKIGYQQALVSGDPLLLPSYLIGEHLDYMLEKPKSCPNHIAPQETNLETQCEINRTCQTFESIRNADAIGSPCPQYKLELGTPQSTSTTKHSEQTASSGCCMDLDFGGGVGGFSSFTEPHQS